MAMLSYLSLILLAAMSLVAFSFRIQSLRSSVSLPATSTMTVRRLHMTMMEEGSPVAPIDPTVPSASDSTDAAAAPITIPETLEEKLRREKMEKIAELKSQEVFVTRETGRYECQACGYVYDESKGITKKGIAPGTPFAEIEKFRCPQCGANKKYFVPETETLSGFKENLKYGLGTNALTSGQKSLLIFGGLAAGFLVFMSGYLLE